MRRKMPIWGSLQKRSHAKQSMPNARREIDRATNQTRSADASIDSATTRRPKIVKDLYQNDR
jgi:hypothetical protein